MRAVGTNILSFVGGLDKVFVIPPFQRNYEWSTEQCDELFRDIISSYKNGKTHYLGNIVYYVGKNSGASFNELILVDGQQRITTILLLLCAIRDSQNEDLKIDSRYLVNDTDIEKFRIKLKQTSYDYSAFSAVINKKEINDDDKSSNVIKNYCHFKELISSSDVKPKDIYDTIQKLEVVDVNLEMLNDLEGVQTVFEKINSTGKKLQQADLIRNYLLLSETTEEQEKLYENYWVKLESDLGNDNISTFSRDYLIIKLFDDVPNDDVYKMFKGYFDENKTPHLNILKDMLKYSKIYSWIKESKCPDEDINRLLEMLNMLKTNDLYPLYMILIERLFDCNILELRKIFNLITDFMIRYRIVSPSGGGGALRLAIHNLMEKIVNEDIQLSYNDILFELSNSSSPANRYPNNEEFKNTLLTSVNTTYARVLLYKMELFETKNIPVRLNKVTVEHLMPQTLSSEWIEYLGGKDNSTRIYDRYLNCIGNLAPISGGYNSKNSNRIWKEKLDNLKEVQFFITSSVTEYKVWNEENIINRNNDIAERACASVIGPLERTRDYESRNASAEFEPGIYPISDDITIMSGKKIKNLIYEDKIFEVDKWNMLIPTICKILLSIDKELLISICKDNRIHKATSKYQYDMKDPILTLNSNFLISAISIDDSNIYVEGAISSTRSRVYAKQLLDIYDLSDKFQIEVE